MLFIHAGKKKVELKLVVNQNKTTFKRPKVQINSYANERNMTPFCHIKEVLTHAQKLPITLINLAT